MHTHTDSQTHLTPIHRQTHLPLCKNTPRYTHSHAHSCRLKSLVDTHMQTLTLSRYTHFHTQIHIHTVLHSHTDTHTPSHPPCVDTLTHLLTCNSHLYRHIQIHTHVRDHTHTQIHTPSVTPMKSYFTHTLTHTCALAFPLSQRHTHQYPLPLSYARNH